jgi:hypothetical protein
VSALIGLIAALLSPQAHVVANGEPTGPLSHGDILTEHHVPTRAICDDRGGTFVLGWCHHENY